MEIKQMQPGDENLIASSPPPFDCPVDSNATRRFLENDTHHLFIAYEADTAVGFVSGIEMTHPDKGTEMFLYELEVVEEFRMQGIGKALVSALGNLAKQRNCYGMWVLTDDDNTAGMATYRSSGTGDSKPQVMLSWDFRGKV